MDPQLEQLHQEQHDRLRQAPSRRDWLTDSIAGVLLLGACALLAAATPASASPDPVLVGTMVVIFALAYQVPFEVGAILTTPVQLVFVPLWFVVDPALLPLVVACGNMLGAGLASLRERKRRHWSHSLLTIPDAWYAIGPAIVFSIAGRSDPELKLWPVYLAALGAQIVCDLASTTLRYWALSGRLPQRQARSTAWIAAADSALAPIGLVLASVVVAEPVAVVAVVPLLGLLSQFAKERDDRILSAIELSRAYRGTAQLMGDVLEADDAYTGGEHTNGVVELAVAVGSSLGLDPTAMRDLEFGALLHDVGKLRVPNEIINKPGQLTDAEWTIIRKHPGYGQEMLDRVGGALSAAGAIVRAHHERWDGAGYPDGLAGEAIPLESRIITVCDSFSAMTTNRSYRRGMNRREALVELDHCSGSQFDPRIVDALKVVLARMPEPASLVIAPDAAQPQVTTKKSKRATTSARGAQAA